MRAAGRKNRIKQNAPMPENFTHNHAALDRRACGISYIHGVFIPTALAHTLRQNGQATTTVTTTVTINMTTNVTSNMTTIMNKINS